MFNRTCSRNMDLGGFPPLGQAPRFQAAVGELSCLNWWPHFTLHPRPFQKLLGQGALFCNTLSSPRGSALVASPIIPDVTSVTGSRERWRMEECPQASPCP